MSKRFTYKMLVSECERYNEKLEAMGSKWRLMAGSRNNYRAVDLATAEQYARHCCQRNLTTGTPRECALDAREWMIGEVLTSG